MNFGKLIGIVVVVALTLLLWRIRQVLLLVFAAIVFATAINGLVRLIQRLPIPISRGVAVAIALLGVMGSLIAAGWFIAPAIIDQLPQYTFFSGQGLDQIQEWYRQFRGLLPGDPLSGTPLSDLLPRLAQLNVDWVDGLISVFTGSLDFFLNLLLVLVLIVMLLANPRSYRHMLLLAFPKFYRRRVDGILTQCDQSLTGWSLAVLFEMVIITAFSWIGLSLIGVPLPLVNALIAGLLTFIPNLGPFISTIPPMLMGLAIHPWMALAVVILYIAIQQLESLVLTPLVMKQQVSLLPAVTLISQVIAALFFGLLGLFLALPLVVVVQVWLKELLVNDILNHWPAPRRLAQPASLQRKSLQQTSPQQTSQKKQLYP
ncbi:MAG: putative permease [Phormidesmis priestleyi Ana]|uniref:Putative permease n=1 Tax=Phormidesmis priestleyi Ana TaxID=1666911 RepID=A0A0P8C3N9_9CYAN|nr:MAG: putative permease [Phormidesmis priestleyi Ana]